MTTLAPVADRISRSIEELLAKHDIHLTTDDFNELHDFVARIAERIKETGQ